MILRAAQRLEPLCSLPMLLGTVATRDLSVGDVADECVRERELRFSLDRGSALLAYKRLPRERVQGRGRFDRLAAERPGPEDFSDDRGVSQESFSLEGSPSSRAEIIPWRVSGRDSASTDPCSRNSSANCSA